MLEVCWLCQKETQGYTFIQRLLLLVWTAVPLGSIHRVCEDVAKPATPKHPGPKDLTLASEMY